ncbi:MAG: hypothetical protein NT117_13975 [Gammaproteobacteria bacterium]|nr:hypothetical protein [Gammaproteobacteria bacterium]
MFSGLEVNEYGRFRLNCGHSVFDTGFESWRPRDVQLDDQAASVAEACRPVYERLHGQRLRVATA